MKEIVPMTCRHASQVAILHKLYLQTRFRGWSGCELLKMYYTALSDHYGGCGFSVLNNDRVVGYVCGRWDVAEVERHFIRRFGLKAAVFVAIQVIVNPKIVFDFFTKLNGEILLDTAKVQGYELRPIVVAPDARGSGVASLLVDELMKDAARRGFPSIHLMTENDNHSANAFYRKKGFDLIPQVDQAKSRYNHYHKSTLGVNI